MSFFHIPQRNKRNYKNLYLFEKRKKMKFLRNVISAVFVVFITLVLLIGLLISVVMVAGKEQRVLVKPNTVLEITLPTKIKDYAPVSYHFFDQLMGLNEEFTGLNTIVQAIDRAKDDEKIKGISIRTGFLDAGLTQIKSIREALESFKISGKFVWAYGDILGQKEYYLSSVADSIYMSPSGSLDFKGLAFETLFFKDFQDQYGLKMEVIRHGKYKSAVEPYLENKMSSSSRLQAKELIASLWNTMTNEIGASRNILQEELNQIADALKARIPEEAVACHLFDALVYEDVYQENLEKIVGAEFSRINLLDYIKTSGDTAKMEEEKIAVVYAQGDIVYGRGDENHIGHEMLVKALEKARSQENIKAIVLRVNSPGGSALASDLIWRALELTKETKPLVVSMGDLAASGGYYIACNAHKIFAEPTTITGSIGVYGMLPNISDFTENRGIYLDRVSTNKNPSYSLFAPMSKEFYAVTQEGVDLVYKRFVSRVSKGRKMTTKAVHELSQGRVWTGEQAKINGLVDDLGGLEEAVEAAADMAGIERFRISYYPSYEKDIRDSLKRIPWLKIQANWLHNSLGSEFFTVFEKVKSLGEVTGIQMRLPFVYQIN
jgi:protease-4